MLRILTILLATSLINACSTSPTTNYYVLTPNSQIQVTNLAERHNEQLSLGVGPVSVPEYLMRSQISYIASNNNLVVSQLDRWSEPLDEAISRVVATNLSRLDSDESVVVYPWHKKDEPDYSIELSITTLNRPPNSKATLEAKWTLFDVANNKILIRTNFAGTLDVSDSSSLALAKTYSDLLAMLSDAIHSQTLSYLTRD